MKKIKKSRALCVCLALLLLAGSGLLGVRQYRSPERSLDVRNGEGQNLSLQNLSAETAKTEKTSAAPTSGGEETNSSGSGLVIAAKSAVLMDAGTGAVLFRQNEKKELPPASVTKIMTMLLVLEAVDAGKIRLDDSVTISERAAGMGGSQMYMEPGEQHTMEELMKGIAMVSANDACAAAAEHVSGSVEIFVEKMNRRAAELGMENTHFVNTNGLPASNHYSSAYDIALMSKELLLHADGHSWFTTWQDTIRIGLPGKETEFGLTNTNKLIKQYPGAIGLKTGYTADAGYCLSGVAKRENRTLIAVVMGCETSAVRLAEIRQLLDYGFANYDTVILSRKGGIVEKISLPKGSPQEINAVSPEEISVLIQKEEPASVTGEAILYPNLELPLKKGDPVGEFRVLKDGEEVAVKPLVSDQNVRKATVGEMYQRILRTLLEE